MSTKATLIIGTSEQNADLYYRTGFFVPDPCVYIEHDGAKIIVLSDLELGRARELAVVDSVLSLTELRGRLGAKRGVTDGLADIVDLVFKDRGIKRAAVPGDFPIKYADSLRKRGYRISVSKDEPFFSERIRKKPEEVKYIAETQRKTERAMARAVEMIRSSGVRGKRLYLGGKLLTSERIKGEINAMLAGLGCSSAHTIVASGVQGSMPHHSGEGPIVAHTPVVIDIFPRSQSTGYYGDMTRTVVKGEPSPQAVKMYKAVLKAQRTALGLIKAGVEVNRVHDAVVESFAEAGFVTGLLDGKQQGFLHSTGHGLGLEIHEPPRIASTNTTLQEGMVVTVEPGLYYEKIGGVRIEDVVVVVAGGCRNLNRFSKKFRV